MKFNWKLLPVFFLLSIFNIIPAARAEDVIKIIIEKQEIREKNRWSIGQWLDTRDKMRLQDLWLALHSPSPYEFYFGGHYRLRESTADGRTGAWSLYGGAYASIFGLEAEYAQLFDRQEIHATFLLRFFGVQADGTNLTALGGMRFTEGGDQFRNAYAGVSLTIYILKHVGLDGLFRYYFNSTPSTAGLINQAMIYGGGAFITFKFLRLYGQFYLRPETLGGVENVTQEIRFGGRFYF